MTTDYDPVAHMVTLDCPYGCGAKLVADETFVGNATCMNISPRYYSDRGDLDECEGYAISYPNSDEVCYAVQNRVSEYKKSLGNAYAQVRNLRWRIDAQERSLLEAIHLRDRISNQHG